MPDAAVGFAFQPVPVYPYPGLRSFEQSESPIFFGRDVQRNELLNRLAHNRFVAVLGTSGSGKSSLVRAGLLPALYRGYLVGTSSRWRIATLRPGSAPLSALAEALAAPGVFAADRDAIRAQLDTASDGLVNAVHDAGLESGENLLVVVDQFEELFRFSAENRSGRDGAEAARFVALLLRAAEAFGQSIYVVLTMRSDFLGECARFPGFAEALNEGQYLVPRLTLEQRHQALERPLQLVDAAIAPRLVERLLADTADDRDQLPVLQHAIMRTYERWRSDGAPPPIDLQHYESVTRTGSALDQHAQQIYDGLPDAVKPWAAKVFRALTTQIDGKAVRRPGCLRWIYKVVGAATAGDREAVCMSIREFARPENSFLICSRGLSTRSVIDISHESLIRKWKLLQEWAQAEAESAGWFRHVAGAVERGAGLMRDPELARVEKIRQDDGWNAVWAAQYYSKRGVRYARIAEYLSASREKQNEDNLAEEKRRNAELEAANELADLRRRELAVSRENTRLAQLRSQDAEALVRANQRQVEDAARVAKAELLSKRLLWVAAGVAILLLGFSVYSEWTRLGTQAELDKLTGNFQPVQPSEGAQNQVAISHPVITEPSDEIGSDAARLFAKVYFVITNNSDTPVRVSKVEIFFQNGIGISNLSPDSLKAAGISVPGALAKNIRDLNGQSFAKTEKTKRKTGTRDSGAYTAYFPRSAIQDPSAIDSVYVSFYTDDGKAFSIGSKPLVRLP
jgi:hypothetical protein